MQKNRKILLIDPPFYRLHKDTYSIDKFPLGLAYLAGVIKEFTDWEVMVYNADFSAYSERHQYNYLTGQGFSNYLENIQNPIGPIWQEVRKVIQDYQPDVVGISSKSQNFVSACIVAEIAKSLNRDIWVVVGGPHPSLMKTEVLKNESIDLGVFGEGELTMVDILQALAHHKPWDTIPGVCYRQGKDFRENPARPLIDDLDSLPFPVSVASLVLKDYYRYPKEAFRNIFAIRGCPFNCSFCGSRYIWSRRVRFRSVENVLSEILEIKKMGVSWIHFEDDTFGVKKSYIRELCNSFISHCPDLSWSCEMHVNLVDQDTIGLMKRAGCRTITLGVESGNNDILKKINKRITIEDAFAAARIIKSNNLSLDAFFIVGFPQEDEDTLQDTIKAIKTIPCDTVLYSIFTPYPGTELFRYCQQQGIIPDDYDISHFTHQSPLNYFCPNIPREKFIATLRQLEKEVDLINARNKFKRYFSYDTYLKLKDKNLFSIISRLIDNLRDISKSRRFFRSS